MEERGEIIFNLSSLVQLLRGDGSGKEGIKVPPKREDMERWRCLSYLELNIILFKTPYPVELNKPLFMTCQLNFFLLIIGLV
jgi:hypothetical protein